MKRVKIKSSNIKSIGYDIDNFTLEIEFKGERVYRYHPISKYMWNKFLEAKSKGHYFNEQIRFNTRINCEEVDNIQAS